MEEVDPVLRGVGVSPGRMLVDRRSLDERAVVHDAVQSLIEEVLRLSRNRRSGGVARTGVAGIEAGHLGMLGVSVREAMKHGNGGSSLLKTLYIDFSRWRIWSREHRWWGQRGQ